MNPVSAFLEHKTAAESTRKEKELELWRTWKTQGQKPAQLEPLLKLYAPVINQKTQQWKAPAVPASAFKAELQQHLIKAFDGYDPNRGAALNTHVEIVLQKAKRYNNRYQNYAYIPEGQAGEIGNIDRARGELSEAFGREPTFGEIGKHIDLSARRVEIIQKARRKDIPASAFESDPTARNGSHEDQQLAVAQHILPQLFPDRPEMHTLFNYTFGTNGHPQMTSTGELARKMKKTEPQISRMKTEMGNTLRDRMSLGQKRNT